MSLFKKKKGGVFEITVKDGALFGALDIKAEDVKRSFAVKTSKDYYCLLYRDGYYLGIPQMDDGLIYPFSLTPTKKGSAKQKKQYLGARLIAVKKDFEMTLSCNLDLCFDNLRIANESYAFKTQAKAIVTFDNTDIEKSMGLYDGKFLVLKRNENYNNVEGLVCFQNLFAEVIKQKLQMILGSSDCPIFNYLSPKEEEIIMLDKIIFEEASNHFGLFGFALKAANGNSLFENTTFTYLE